MADLANDKNTLWTLAVNAGMRRAAWLPGDQEIIWYDPKSGVRAYLQEAGGKLILRLSNHDLTVTLFEEDPVTNFFDLTQTAQEDYKAWSARVMADLKHPVKLEAPADLDYARERRETVESVFAAWYPKLADEINQITIVEVRPRVKKPVFPKKYPPASAHRGHS